MKRLLALFLLLFLAGCGEKPDGTVLARVGDQVVTDKEFYRRVQSLPKQLRPIALQRKKEFIEDIASEYFLLKEAERQGLQKDPDVKSLIESARRKIIVAKLIENEVDKKLSLDPQEASSYYESRKSDFMTPLLLRASHILVKSPEEAESVKSQLSAGADFEETARKRSADQTAIRGGDLGYFQKGQFVPEFEEVAFTLKKGQVSDIVKSQFGFHIIKLTDRIEPTLRDFNAVKPVVEERIATEKRTKAFKAYISKLKGETPIKFEEGAIDAIQAPQPPASAEKPTV